jgi:hypothetical protein
MGWQASQKPGVAYRDPLIPGAPGDGEGHNTGQGVNITAALAVKKIMDREKLPGTIMLWPQAESPTRSARRGRWSGLGRNFPHRTGCLLYTPAYPWGLECENRTVMWRKLVWHARCSYGAWTDEAAPSERRDREHRGLLQMACAKGSCRG